MLGTRTSPAFTKVESPRRSLSQMTVTTHSAPQPEKTNHQPIKWPQPVKDYVQRAHAPDSMIAAVSLTEMAEQLKATIQDAAQTGILETTDWATYPLPQEIILQNRAMQEAFRQQAHSAWAQMSFHAANTPQYPGNSKKRSFEDLSAANMNVPPWKQGSNAGNNPLSDRITHDNKKQSNREKRMKKSMNLEPSSHFQADLDKRRQRFELDKKPHHSMVNDDEVSHGPVVGTCQVVLKSYYRLTSAPKPENVRPQNILEQALELLKQKWRQGSDYHFVCDQLKSIRQDLTVQSIKNNFTVKVYETHAIIALEKGDLGEYNQCQTQLRGLYAAKLNGRPAEFKAYRILYLIHTANRTGMNEILAELTSTDKVMPAIMHALKVRAAVASGNYHMLFKLYLDCPNMGAYLMDTFVQRERLAALARICKSSVFPFHSAKTTANIFPAM